jgi:hypothetical protein
MASIPVTTLSNAKLFCDLLFSALQREEKDLFDIKGAAVIDWGRPEWFLTSVSHAPEFAIGYLVRKEALRRGVAIDSEHRYVDFCLLEDGKYTASLEVKVWQVGQNVRALQEDVRKVSIQSVPNLPASERYNGWILIGTSEMDTEQFVRTTIAGIAELGQYEVSDSIPINGSGIIRVAIFNPVKIAVRCSLCSPDGCASGLALCLR